MALRRGLILIELALCLNVGTVAAAEPSPLAQKQAQEIYDTVFSPYCPGRLLRDCPSWKAHELKERILTELASGKSSQQVTDELFTEFGSVIRALPETKGFGLFAWLAPILFVVAGGICILAWLRSVRSKEQSSAPSSQGKLDEHMKARIAKELAK